jgi:TorA maturation chaperone TorD
LHSLRKGVAIAAYIIGNPMQKIKNFLQENAVEATKQEKERKEEKT